MVPSARILLSLVQRLLASSLSLSTTITPGHRSTKRIVLSGCFGKGGVIRNRPELPAMGCGNSSAGSKGERGRTRCRKGASKTGVGGKAGRLRSGVGAKDRRSRGSRNRVERKALKRKLLEGGRGSICSRSCCFSFAPGEENEEKESACLLLDLERKFCCSSFGVAR